MPPKKAKKIKPNAMCPCESGKKYKKCCKNKDVGANKEIERLQEERDKLKTALSHQTSSPQGWSIDLKTGETTGNWESVQKAILEENKNVGEFAQKYLRPYREQKDETNVEIITKEFLKLDPYEQRYIIDRWNNEESYRSLIGIDENNRSKYEKLFESILENHHITKYEISDDINDLLQRFTHSRIIGERDGKFSAFLVPLQEHLSGMSKKKWNWLKERKGRKGSSHLYEIIQTSYLNDDIKFTKDEWEIINHICNEVDSDFMGVDGEFMNKKNGVDGDEVLMDAFGVMSYSVPPKIYKILDHKVNNGGELQYKIKWKGYESDENTWESKDDLLADGFKDDVSEYENSINDPDFQKALEFSKVHDPEKAAQDAANALLQEVDEEEQKKAKENKENYEKEEKRREKEKNMVRLEKEKIEAREKEEKDGGEDIRKAAEERKKVSEAAEKKVTDASILIQKTARGKLGRNIYSKINLAYSNPENFDTYEKKKHYMNALLDVLRKDKGIGKNVEDDERTFEEQLFEAHIAELTEIIRFISDSMKGYLFVVVGGAAVKAHHLKSKKKKSKGTGHKTTDFDVKVYPIGEVISEDKREMWVAEARFKIYELLRKWHSEQSNISKTKGEKFKFSILKGSRMVQGGAYKIWCEHGGTWKEDLVQPLCVDPTVPIKVSLMLPKKIVPLLEFSFSPSETLTKGRDYTNIVMKLPDEELPPMNYLTLGKLIEVLHQNITKSGGFMERIGRGEPNVYRKKILSWLKQLNSLNAVERNSPDGETKGHGGTTKKYRKKYKTRRIKKRKCINKSLFKKKIRSLSKTKKKHRRKKRKSRKKIREKKKSRKKIRKN